MLIVQDVTSFLSGLINTFKYTNNRETLVIVQDLKMKFPILFVFIFSVINGVSVQEEVFERQGQEMS